MFINKPSFSKAGGNKLAKDTNHKDTDDEEISFDFISKFFKSKKGSKEKAKDNNNNNNNNNNSDDEELTDIDDEAIDVENLKKALVKYLPVLLILIPIFISVFLRIQPAYLPITDEWAQNTVYSNVKNNLRAQIDSQYQLMPESQREKLVGQEFQKLLDNPEYRAQFDQMIISYSAGFKERIQDESGQTYLLAIDPYFWWKHTKNIIENGHPGEILKDGKPWDTHMFAPKGREVPPDMGHAYIMAYMYKFMKFFYPDLLLKNLIFYVPVIIGTLCVIPAFFLGRKVSGNLGGFVAAVIIAAHSSFLGRTAAGFADTDAYNVFFPLLISWLFILMLDAKSYKKTAIMSALAGATTGLYAWIWSGWWYIFDFLMVVAGVYIVSYIFINHKNKIKEPAKILKIKEVREFVIAMGMFLLAAGIFVSYFASFPGFINAFANPLEFTQIHQVGTKSVWPNVFTTVAEQNNASLEQIMNSIGGGGVLAKVMIIIAIIGAILSMTNFKDKSSLKVGVLLIIWSIGTVFASMKGVRFMLLLVPAYSIAVGVFFGILYKKAPKIMKGSLDLDIRVINGAVIILALLALYVPISSGYTTSIQQIPSMNDAWHDALHEIDMNASQDAIINSWWDFGHWFKRIGNRPVTFDGTSQNTPQAHWIGLSLLTDNEKLSTGILRMLDCGANDAFEVLDNVTNKSYLTVDMLYNIVQLEKDEAREYLTEYGIDDENTTKVLSLTHCQPPENYYITSQDMIGKSGVWGHFGAWDFVRATIFNQARKMQQTKAIDYIMKEFGYTQDTAMQLYYEIKSLDTERGANDWIASWPSYISGTAGCQKDNNQLVCQNTIQGQPIVILINTTTWEPRIPTTQGDMKPSKFSYVDNDGIFHVKDYNSSQYPIGVSVVPSGDGHFNMIMDPRIVGSMFNRLFYYEGEGLRHFNRFNDKRSFTGDRIIVWKVDWDGKDENDYFGQTMTPVAESTESDESDQKKIEETIEKAIEEAKEGEEAHEGITDKNIEENSSSYSNSSYSNITNITDASNEPVEQSNES
jgi:dolichyl-phosphooligosaccharide-protein glycotransferase